MEMMINYYFEALKETSRQTFKIIMFQVKCAKDVTEFWAKWGRK